jgi:hypothetical protein
MIAWDVVSKSRESLNRTSNFYEAIGIDFQRSHSPYSDLLFYQQPRAGATSLYNMRLFELLCALLLHNGKLRSTLCSSRFGKPVN